MVYLCGGGRRWCLHLPRTDGFQKPDHVPTEVPFSLLQRRVEQECGVLAAHRRHLHVLVSDSQGKRIETIVIKTLFNT